MREFVKIIFVLFLIQRIDCAVKYKSLNKNTGLIFYDPVTNKTLLPPIVSYQKLTSFRQGNPNPFGQPCTCASMNCECCAGMNIQQFNFNQKLCTHLRYDPNEFALTMEVMMNNRSIFTREMSGKNPPPACVPVPIPYIPIQMDFCLKLFDIFTPGRNLHMCLDMLARVQKAPIVVLHFDCMRMGLDGVSLLKPEDGGGVVGGTPDTETGVEPELPDGAEPDVPQIDYDIYDEITEIKLNV